MELFDLIFDKEYLDDNLSRIIFRQMVEAIEYCHNNGIIVRDIKPENIMFNPQNNKIKLIDFGFANYIKNDPSNVFCGSYGYSPPEIYMEKEYYGQTSDIWSLGVVLYIMLQGRNPFDIIDENDHCLVEHDNCYDENSDNNYSDDHDGDHCDIERCKKIAERTINTNITFYSHPQINENAKKLIIGILQKEPSKRLTIEQIKNTPILIKIGTETNFWVENSKIKVSNNFEKGVGHEAGYEIEE